MRCRRWRRSKARRRTISSARGCALATRPAGNAPDLRAEVSDAKELSLLRETALGSLRISVFEDDVRDAIFLQRSMVGAATVNTVQNVDRVRTRGVEAALQSNNLFVNGLDLQAGLTLAQARILANAVVPDSGGKGWPRVPRLRAPALASYRSGPWTSSIGVRHEGRQYGTLDNSDVIGNKHGGVSSFTVVSARVAYDRARVGRLAFGVENLADRRYYVGPHPYPGRTGYAEAQFAF